MSEADKMLEELGFNLVIDDNKQYPGNCLQYEDDKNTLCFYLDSKDFTYNTTDILRRTYISPGIDMTLLQAINMKCKELGWIE